MRIFINTFGTRGDVQPYVALGKGLKAAGHSVTLCTSSRFEGFINEHGLDYAYMTDELLQLMDTDAGREAMEDTVGLFGTAKSMLKLVQATKPLNRQMMIDSWEAAQAVNPELVIYHPKALAALSIAEKFGAPAVMASLQPMMVPTTEFPPIGIPDLKLGGWYNRLSYKTIPMGYRMYGKMVNEIRQERMGLGPFPKSSGVMYTAQGEPIHVLHGYSRHVVPRPADWPEQSHVTGYWFLDPTEEWEPPDALLDFLEGGDPPIYVGFGSMAGRDPGRLAGIVVEALQQASVRGILATGWGGLDVNELPESILKVDTVPHDWLFPRVAAVVHHGGAGTTAAGLRAGRATLICSFMGDQPFWGSRVHALGVGPEPIPQKKLSVDGLASALHTLTSDTAMRDNANALGERIRQEDGITNAVGVIEGFLQPG